MSESVESVLEMVNAGEVVFDEDLDVLADATTRLFPEAVVAESIAAACGRTGLNREVIRAAKAMGAQAFRMGNRIECRALWEFVTRNYEPIREKMTGEGSVKAEIEKERLLKLKLERAALEGRSYDREAVNEWAEETGRKLKAILQERLVQSFPDVAEGMTAAEMRPRCQELVDGICGMFEGAGGRWKG